MSATISRRALLKGALGGAGTMIFLPYLEAFGAEAPPLRFCPIMAPNGMIGAAWRPKAPGKLTELPPTLLPLAAFREQLCLLGGLDNVAANGVQDGPGDHARGAATYLTCRRARKSETQIEVGISIDQVVANAVGAGSRYSSVEISGDNQAFADSGYAALYSYTISYATPYLPRSNEYSPRRMFDRMFRGLDAKTSAEDRAKRLRQRLSILDFVRNDAAILLRRVGREDRRRVEEFQQSIRDVERRLLVQGDTEKACPVAAIDVPEEADYPTRLRLFSDLLALAFQCDLTRVASYLFAPEGSERAYPFLGIESGHHSLTHHGGNEEKIAKVTAINRFHSEILAHFLGRLATIKEGDGSLLDRTVVLYGSNIDDGNVHNHDDLPLLVAGAGSRLFKPGEYVRFAQGTPLANLHLRIAQVMGASLTSFGNSTGALTL